MGKTYKIERARALHKGCDMRQFHNLKKRDGEFKDVKLIKTGNYINTDDGIDQSPRAIENGGVRYGNQRRMRSKLKTQERRRDRKRQKYKFDDE